jgi:hypothetical protein
MASDVCRAGDVGTIVESVSDDVQTFCAGAVIYQVSLISLLEPSKEYDCEY